MKSTLAERLARCDHEIAQAIAESARPHTEAEHAGILLWEMDWRIERESILEDVAARKVRRRLLNAKKNADYKPSA